METYGNLREILGKAKGNLTPKENLRETQGKLKEHFNETSRKLVGNFRET